MREVADCIFTNKVLVKLMRKTDVKKLKNYDEKGYKVTQSELLSGGISPNNTQYFSQELKDQIEDCIQLVGSIEHLALNKQRSG